MLCRQEGARGDQGESTYFPDYELVVILAAEGRQVRFVVRERETLDQNLVHLQAMHHLQSVEVPHNDISLATQDEKECEFRFEFISVTVAQL